MANSISRSAVNKELLHLKQACVIASIFPFILDEHANMTRLNTPSDSHLYGPEKLQVDFHVLSTHVCGANGNISGAH